MATRTTRKKRKRRTSRRSSRVPAVILIAVMLGVGGLLVVSAQNSDRPANDSSPSPTTVTTSDTDDPSSPGDATSPTPGSSVVTIGSVAPPVSVDTGSGNAGGGNSGDGDGDEGLVLDDFTLTDTPQRPSRPANVPSRSVTNGRITGPLPDGYYLGYLDGVDSNTTIVVRFDAPSGPVFDAALTDLLYVSLRVDARDPAHPGSAIVAPRTLLELLDRGEPTFMIPDTDDLVLIGGTHLFTVSGGRLIGIEAVS